MNFSRFLAVTRISRVNFTKITGDDQDNLHTEFLALNADLAVQVRTLQVQEGLRKRVGLSKRDILRKVVISLLACLA